MRWLLWAAVVDLLVMLTIQLLPDSLSTVGLTAAVVVTAGSVAIGVTRPDIVDIDRLLGTTVQYGVLLVGTLALDVVVLLVTGRAVGDRIDSDQSLVLAVFVVVLLYAPLRHRLSRLVRRWVVGEKDDPYAVVSGLARRLEASDASEEQLLAVAQTVAAAFRSPYVGVELRQVTGELLLAEHGRRPSRTRPLPISYRGQEIGRLLLPSDTVGTRLRAADERLLADVVRQAAAATRATELAAELQRSRERLVTAVEDERRRLRRDLHDGLGPTLAAVASRIDTARITAARSPAESDRVLALARSEVAGLLTDVRRLVHGLRPPALDEVGLVRAVEQHAARLAGPGLLVEVDAPDDLPALPAAVEVAAYRIVAEALTNVVRHAGAARCLVTLDLRPAQLVVEVVDDGVGIEATTPAGVGLLSMRERALELGGRCGVVLSEGGGTRVTAVLPVRAPVLAGSSAAEAAGTREEA
jgi:signal transduction histidine kinase